MAELFSDEWMKGYMAEWNKEPGLADALAEIDFNSVIGYGFDGEDNPRGILKVEVGKVVAAGAYNGEALNWDIRADKDLWEKWKGSPPGMMGLGMAYTTRKLKFKVGDYGAMIKDPRMATPFIKSFGVMGRV
ncbi:SCP-2 sterol transfer family protein [Gammaproteobacteria bacterium]